MAGGEGPHDSARPGGVHRRRRAKSHAFMTLNKQSSVSDISCPTMVHAWILLASLAASLIAVSSGVDVQWSSACIAAGSGMRPLELRAGRVPECLAWGSYQDTINSTGKECLRE